MNKSIIIEKTKGFVKNTLYNEGSGHDWYHIERVYNTSNYIASKEDNVDVFIVQMVALLHDIDDWKFSKENQTDTSKIKEFLIGVDANEDDIVKIKQIIKTMSFKGGIVDSTQYTIEGMIVQDADRLDAIGAIGIARTFTYGGYKNRVLYDPNISPMQFNNLDDVKSSKNHTINHFYEKLLKLKDLMNTSTGKELAVKRHKVMEDFLNEFYNEWNLNIE